MARRTEAKLCLVISYPFKRITPASGSSKRAAKASNKANSTNNPLPIVAAACVKPLITKRHNNPKRSPLTARGI